MTNKIERVTGSYDQFIAGNVTYETAVKLFEEKINIIIDKHNALEDENQKLNNASKLRAFAFDRAVRYAEKAPAPLSVDELLAVSEKFREYLKPNFEIQQ